MAHATAQFFGPRLLGPGEGPKGQISLNKSVSNIFKPNRVCLLTNERYKTYQTGFSFSRLGHAPGVGLWGYRGVFGVNFFPEFNQISCVSDSNEWHMQRQIFLVPAPWGHGEGPKGQIS